jgi:hypothetical protein
MHRRTQPVNLREGGTAYTYAGGCYQARDELTCVPLLLRWWFLFATVEMAEWPRSGPYLRALAEWGFDSRLATRFAILGRNLFASPRARGSFLYYCGVGNNFSFFILTELGVGGIVGKVGARLVFCEVSKEKSVPTVRQLLIRPYKIQEASGHLRVSYCVAEFQSDALL